MADPGRGGGCKRGLRIERFVQIYCVFIKGGVGFAPPLEHLVWIRYCPGTTYIVYMKAYYVVIHVTYRSGKIEI